MEKEARVTQNSPDAERDSRRIDILAFVTGLADEVGAAYHAVAPFEPSMGAGLSQTADWDQVKRYALMVAKATYPELDLNAARLAYTVKTAMVRLHALATLDYANFREPYATAAALDSFIEYTSSVLARPPATVELQVACMYHCVHDKAVQLAEIARRASPGISWSLAYIKLAAKVLRASDLEIMEHNDAAGIFVARPTGLGKAGAR